MNQQETERVLNDGSLYPLGVVYLTEPLCTMVVVHNIEEILPDTSFLLVMVNVEEN